MKDEMFQQLVASLKEGGAILRGKKAPSRDPWISSTTAQVSAISIPEVLGYPGLSADDEAIFEAWSAELMIHAVNGTNPPRGGDTAAGAAHETGRFRSSPRRHSRSARSWSHATWMTSGTSLDCR